MYDDDDGGGGDGADVQERVLESERRKRHVDERRDTEARRHSDYVKYALYAISLIRRSFTASNYMTSSSRQTPVICVHVTVMGNSVNYFS